MSITGQVTAGYPTVPGALQLRTSCPALTCWLIGCCTGGGRMFTVIVAGVASQLAAVTPSSHAVNWNVTTSGPPPASVSVVAPVAALVMFTDRRPPVPNGPGALSWK